MLETIPLLEACVKEALRVAAPARGRHPRVVPPGGWTYKGRYLPEGTIISGSTMFHCLDPAVYLEPLEFRPERWLVQDSKSMQQSLVPFSHGSRSCIGQNLAKAELFIGISQVVMNLDPGECLDSSLDYSEYSGITFPTTLVKVTLRPRKKDPDELQ
ncbi:hypothetical protein ONS95_005827 [Cadophora gregata]|uniref:uncharacterized protein n=1 Tax=Cadophora gregata TaxID=51156 RepID=UPI0026DC70C4|nr:uncharacterized protein ONS95_005827 [Cadophora gregata]KAK0103828.1 hypothetical protein ONS95_005827 [Cadophora gregata]KAK0108015.1 hypothetical protein ONS96_003794 [Cadophora gregata f. sp. sojae]